MLVIMEKELVNFILKNNLSVFNKSKTEIKTEAENIFKTKDARQIYTKTIGKISENFCFTDTRGLVDFFDFTQENSEIKKRQEFFKSIPKGLDNSFLKNLKSPEKSWKPEYGIIAVTENEKTLIELKKMDIPVKIITSSEDVSELEGYDIVQVIDCDESSLTLERLPQTIFVSSINDVYLERYLELLSGWRKNLEILEKNNSTSQIKEIISFLSPIFDIINKKKAEKITRDSAEEKLESINNKISEKMKSLSLDGSALFQMLSSKKFSGEILKIIEESIESSEIPENIFERNIPVTLDEKELAKVLREQDSNEHITQAEKIKANSAKLKQIPQKLRELENQLLLMDFYSGISRFFAEDSVFHEDSSDFTIYSSKNLFLDKPQAVSFYLNEQNKCSILTGANSGGKTTLLEHIIQLIAMQQIGLPVSGSVKMPIFSEIYYFAKNKGSTSKGAFETLLTQMSKIKTGRKTLILADEIESVTEPGVAGKIIAATADFFIKKGCFLIIATHLGKEIQNYLPPLARIDGIEAKGLDENFELIVDHNPVIGRLANSTPELIIEKMSQSGEDYFQHLKEWVKK